MQNKVANKIFVALNITTLLKLNDNYFDNKSRK